MKKVILFILLVEIALVVVVNAQKFQHFITVSSNKLMEGDKEFRFLSFNIPNLNYVEDEMDFKTLSPFRLPTEFEIRDALLSIKQMGGRVARLYTIPVKRKEQPENNPAHVWGPGIFNEEAFKVNDLMLALANEYGIRLIFPIVNNWKWMGGRPQYAEFRGKTEDEFWSDPQIIDDVKKTIEFTLNRTNTITQTKYKDDKAILCWETGNEQTSTPQWTAEITKYIKQLDKNHLVMDGYHAIDKHPVRIESINNPYVDIISSHHYETNPFETLENIQRNRKIINGRKPYIVGEFGFQSTTALEKTVNFIIESNDIAGALIWSLRYHREEGGFYWHSEPLGLGIYKAYHWPGFSSGELYDETNFLAMYRIKSFEIQGIPVPLVEKPKTPKLLPIHTVYDINWQGSTGASFYTIERAENLNGPWQKIASEIDDASVQYFSLFHDKTAEIGKFYFYRVIAGNNAGISDPSNIMGPVGVENQAIIDEMSNYGVFYNYNEIQFDMGSDRKYKEDMFRLKGNTESELIYYVPGNTVSVVIFSFEKNENASLRLLSSLDGIKYDDLDVKKEIYFEGKNDYGALYPVLYKYSPENKTLKYIKILFLSEAEISRVKIIYN